MGSPGGSDGKESACNGQDLSSAPGKGRSPGEGNGNPFQYSCLENSRISKTTIFSCCEGIFFNKVYIFKKFYLYNWATKIKLHYADLNFDLGGQNANLNQ